MSPGDCTQIGGTWPKSVEESAAFHTRCKCRPSGENVERLRVPHRAFYAVQCAGNQFERHPSVTRIRTPKVLRQFCREPEPRIIRRVPKHYYYRLATLPA